MNGVTGFVDTVNALKVAEGLTNAINAPTVGNAFEAIANVAGDLVIRPGLADEYRLIAEAKKRIEKQERRLETGFNVARVTTLTRARAEDLNLRLIPFLPWWIPIIYLFGAILLLINVRSQWYEWKEFWWHTPMWQRGQRLIAVLSRVTRLTAFVLLMPWTMLAGRAIPWIAVIGVPLMGLW
ncbi:MAG: hypothetical protein ACREA4_07725 [Nitrososphaera sp.]